MYRLYIGIYRHEHIGMFILHAELVIVRRNCCKINKYVCMYVVMVKLVLLKVWHFAGLDVSHIAVY